jgi:hypothetical protein
VWYVVDATFHLIAAQKLAAETEVCSDHNVVITVECCRLNTANTGFRFSWVAKQRIWGITVKPTALYIMISLYGIT